MAKIQILSHHHRNHVLSALKLPHIVNSWRTWQWKLLNLIRSTVHNAGPVPNDWPKMLVALVAKRLPGVAYRHRATLSVAMVTLALLGYLAYVTGYFCTTFEPWNHLSTMCLSFRRRQTLGDMCQTICTEGGIEEISCVRQSGKGPIFGVRLRGGTDIVVKSALRMGRTPEVFHWIDIDGKETFPTEEQYVTLVQNRVKSKLNWTLEGKEARRLAHFPGGQTSEDRSVSELRQLEMKEVWGLLHNHEYLMTMLHSRRDIFADLIGSCGQYYMTERLGLPLLDFESEGIDTNFESWAARVHLAVRILELIEQLEEDDIVICDVRPVHFGVNSAGKVKLVNLDGTLLRRIADAMTASGRPCSIDSDCWLIDCRSDCNAKTRTCDSPVTSTNLQVICEKIFLGWSSPDRIIYPGLLLTLHTPQGLMALLRQCAQPPQISNDPQERAEIARHVAQRLDDALTELDSSLEGYRNS
ncbi:Protein-kinase domain of FAM69 [Nesidiocoris tenuis]|uniref:Protein-kinase domain of FAM69 n=2 Tax=Nesidiocoris tenuis TaxID=355587 RepID=A0ABN7BEK4_9HEMI|nr:Protein-kinase domain of FAM69 [Nesidiocoris tenuis]